MVKDTAYPGTSAPRAVWSDMQDSEHFVQFYENDSFLVESVAGFIGSGMREGYSAVVIATDDHRTALENWLDEEEGFCVGDLCGSGQLVLLDAAATLEKFMVGGMPDPERFRDVVGGLVARMRRGGRKLRAFGEMVALLWQQGNSDAAIRLEELWNDLGTQHMFSLFCAYPMCGFHGESAGKPFVHVCRAHTRVIPAESYSAQPSEDERLRAISLLQQKAGALEVEINARKKAAASLDHIVAERTAKLQEMVAELETFSYSISHDMRSPLRAMQGYAESILQDFGPTLDSGVVARLERMQQAATRLDLLIRDVLAYSKVAHGDTELAPVSLAKLVADLVQNRPDLEAHRSAIVVQQPLHSVLGHEAYLTQCLTNLMSNALKFVRPGVPPRVAIRSEVIGDKVRLWVSDDGVGIHPDHYNRIFEMFGRVYPQSAYEGTGIGLAIVKRAVTRMGGEVGFRSELGRGSDFWLTLNKAPDA